MLAFPGEQRLTKAFCQCPLLMVFRPHQPHLRYRILFVYRQPAHFTELDALKGGREDRYPQSGGHQTNNRHCLPHLLGNLRRVAVAAQQAEDVVVQASADVRVEKDEGLARQRRLTEGWRASG